MTILSQLRGYKRDNDNHQIRDQCFCQCEDTAFFNLGWPWVYSLWQTVIEDEENKIKIQQLKRENRWKIYAINQPTKYQKSCVNSANGVFFAFFS